MSSNLRRQLPKLVMVAKTKKPHLRCEMLKELTKDKQLCSACRELIKNVRSRNVPLPDGHKRKLLKDKELIKTLKKILKSNLTHTQQRKLITQTGKGWFLPLVIPLVADLIGSAISKARE